MSAWAGLAGAAQGVLGGWDDNREAIKAQAERDFKMTLENTRMQNAKKASDQLAADMLDPSTPQGALAAHNAKAETDAINAEYAREDERDRLKMENDLRVAQAKSGKSADSGELKYVLGQIKRQDAILADEYASESDKKAARQELKALDTYHRQLSGVDPRKPKKTKDEFYADVHKNKDDPNAMAQLKAKLGDAGFKQVMDDIGKLYPAPATEVVADTTTSGMLSKFQKQENTARKAANKKKASDKRMAKATLEAKNYIDKVTQGKGSSTQSFMTKGLGGFRESSVSEKLRELAKIADNPDVDAKTRQKAKAMVEKAIQLKKGEKAGAR